jgi:2-polyprenyl-6-hydroxyphenyl methylase / 3-demethylubiquinone-9 3-methyltransferase
MGTDNTIYDTLAHAWWDDDTPVFSTLRYFINPVRFAYFKGILDTRLRTGYRTARLLDVGCGGGFLSEEFARTGMSVTGIDSSRETIDAAERHARHAGLQIDYRTGFGESLPFEDASFDIVSCCDALEHVDNPEMVIAEISRVLKNNSVFFYDTINRTPVSLIMSIKVMQEWKSTAFVIRGTHMWEKFIRPAELRRMMGRHRLVSMEQKGLSPGWNFIAHYLNLRRAAGGKITYRELGARLRFRVSRDTSNSYIGYAVKKAG